MKHRHIKFLLSAMILAYGTTSCSLSPSKQVQVKIDLQDAEPNTGFSRLPGNIILNGIVDHPISSSAFDCYAVNVMGPDIPSTDSKPHQGSASTSCAYPGIITPLLAPSASTVEMVVPTGTGRVFQVLGLQTKIGCPIGNPLIAYMDANAPANHVDTPHPFRLYELGRTTTDLLDDTVLNIQNSYNPAAPVLPLQCGKSLEATATAPTKLTLHNAWDNVDALGNYTDSPGASFPPSGGAVISGPNQTLLTTPGNTTEIRKSANATTLSRFDFAFNLTGLDLSQYREIQARVVGSGGRSSFTASCNNVAPMSDPGLRIRVFNELANAWMSGTGAEHGSLDPATAITLSIPAAIAPVSTFAHMIGGTPYLLVTIRSMQLSAGACSNVSLRQVEAFLVR